MKKFLLAMAAMLISTPALAADNTYADVGRWSVMSYDHDCTMITVFDDKSMLMLTYDVGQQSSWISFTDPAIKSLKDGETKKLEVVFTNGTVGTLDTGWGTVDFKVMVLDTGERILRKRFTKQMLDDFAKYKIFGLFYDDRAIESMPLTGAAEAVKSLRACATERFRANPSDPFE